MMLAMALAATPYQLEVGTAWAKIVTTTNGVRQELRYPEDKHEVFHELRGSSEEGTVVMLGNDKIKVELSFSKGRWLLDAFTNVKTQEKLRIGKPVLTAWDRAKTPIDELNAGVMPSICIGLDAAKGDRYGVALALSRFRSCDADSPAAAVKFFLGDGESLIEETACAYAGTFGDSLSHVSKVDLAFLPGAKTTVRANKSVVHLMKGFSVETVADGEGVPHRDQGKVGFQFWGSDSGLMNVTWKAE